MPIGEKKIELNCFFRTHLPDKIAVVDWAVEVGCFSGKESPMYSQDGFLAANKKHHYNKPLKIHENVYLKYVKLIQRGSRVPTYRIF